MKAWSCGAGLQKFYERLITDPFSAYSAPRGDLTPSALECRAVPRYAARLALVPPQEEVEPTICMSATADDFCRPSSLWHYMATSTSDAH